MKKIDLTQIAAFRSQVIQVAEAYSTRTLSANERIKKSLGFSSHKQAELLRASTDIGLEFLRVFKNQMDTLSANSSFRTALLQCLPILFSEQTLASDGAALYQHLTQSLDNGSLTLSTAEPEAVKQSPVLPSSSPSPTVASSSISSWGSCSASEKILEKEADASPVLGNVPDTLDLTSASIISPPKPVCPITLDEMAEPVRANDGYIYEKAALKTWMSQQRAQGAPVTSPVTGEPLIEMSAAAEATGQPSPGLPGKGTPHRAGNNIFSYPFQQGPLLKIEIGINFINLYQDTSQLSFHDMFTDSDPISVLLRDIERGTNITHLSGHHQEQFSICKDHGGERYSNPIFQQANQPEFREHFHPVEKGDSHTHFVYGWDGVTLKDLARVFSYVKQSDTTAISDQTFQHLLTQYGRFMANNILAHVAQATSGQEVVSFLRAVSTTPLVTPQGHLSPLVAAKLNLITQADLDACLESCRNSRLRQHLTHLVSDLKAFARDQNYLAVQTNAFDCAPATATTVGYKSQQAPDHLGGPAAMDINALLEIIARFDLLDDTASNNTAKT